MDQFFYDLVHDKIDHQCSMNNDDQVDMLRVGFYHEIGLSQV